MNTVKIDNDIVRQLENNRLDNKLGMKDSDREQRIKLLLTHAYMAVKMYWAMSPEDRYLATEWNRKFRRSFSFRNFLKARKTNSRKNYLPLHLPCKKKNIKKKRRKTHPP